MKPTSRGQDLVSTTLDRYLKHRFNGELLPYQRHHGTDAANRLSATDTNNLKYPSPDTTFSSNSSNGLQQENSTNNNEKMHRSCPGQPKASFLELDDNSISEEQLAKSARKIILDSIKQIDENNVSNTNNLIKPASICCFSVKNIRPCCAAVRDDLRFMAMGFENSLIYIWNLRGSKASFKLDKSHIRRDISTFDLSMANQLVILKKKSNQIDINDPPSSSYINALNASNEKETHSHNQISSDETPWFRKTLFAHSGPVYGLYFVPDSELLLSCSEDTTIRLWCLKSFCNIAIYRGHAYPIWAIDVAPHGGHFVSASMDTTARMWTFEKTSPIRIFCGHDSSVEYVKFHPNGKYIATGSSDSTVRLWSIADGNMVRLMVGHRTPVSCLSFLPDGKHLASSSHDNCIKIWDLFKNSVVRELNCSQPSSCPIYSLSFSNDQVFLSSCGADRLLRIWRIDDIASEKEIITYSLDSTNIDQMDSSQNPNCHNLANSTDSRNSSTLLGQGSHYLKPRGTEIVDFSPRFTNLLHSQFLDNNILLVFGFSSDS